MRNGVIFRETLVVRIPPGGKELLLNWLLVAGGGAIGSALRYGLALFVQRSLGASWPFGTLAANIIGSFIIGCTYELLVAKELFSEEVRLFTMIGLLGGFTTFSAFSLETLLMFQEGDWLLAGLYVALSVIGCLLAVWAGFQFAAAVT